MGKFIAAALSAVAAVAFVFFIVILGTLMGAIAGWIIGLFFSNTILSTLARFGVDVVDLRMWQLGATLAFVGSFFKAIQNSRSKA